MESMVAGRQTGMVLKQTLRAQISIYKQEAKRANSKENVSFEISKPAPVVYFLQQSHIS